MDSLANSKIDFMRYRRVAIVISAGLIVVSVFTVFFGGNLNLGIDFAGGTQLNVKFQGSPEIERLRAEEHFPF